MYSKIVTLFEGFAFALELPNSSVLILRKSGNPVYLPPLFFLSHLFNGEVDSGFP
jgi:hypothetical protein